MPDNFQWSDELVKEYIDNLLLSQLGRGILNGINDKMNTFKQSKQPKEKDIHKDWEIQSMKHNNSEVYFTIKPNGNFSSETFPNEHFVLEDDLLYNKNKTYLIHSVKRLSDGVVFKIGDYFNNYLREVQSPIKEFIIDGNSMKVKADGILAPLELEFISIRDTPKEPLFTTEDGVEIFEYTDYWQVEILPPTFNLYEARTHGNSINQFYNENSIKKFKHREKAKGYINSNKPIETSYKELYEYCGVSLPIEVGEYFKSKINP